MSQQIFSNHAMKTTRGAVLLELAGVVLRHLCKQVVAFIEGGYKDI